MTCVTAELTVFVDLPIGRTIPVQVEYVQAINVECLSTTYTLLDVSISTGHLRTITIWQAEYCLDQARTQFLSQLHRRA